MTSAAQQHGGRVHARGDFQGMRRIYDGYKYGEIPYGHFNPLTIINSFIDKSRFDADQCALYYITFARCSWRRRARGVGRSTQEYGDLVGKHSRNTRPTSMIPASLVV